MKRPLTLLFGLLLLGAAVFNFLLMNQNGHLRVQLREANAKGPEPGGLGLLRLTEGIVPFCRRVLDENRGVRKPPLSLLIFLSQKDCPACLQEAEIWEALYRKYSAQGFAVLGLVPQADSGWGVQFAKDYELTYPVVSVKSEVLEFLGIPGVTPFKVMVDSLHRVAYLSGANSEPEDQKNFGEVAERLCEAYLQPGKVSAKLGQSP